ncbi:MAG: DUF423 domain-containing protein [Bacteroidetes bacterium]|nr:MAG: DUF423 domain-containing protein [Bacteroidota bacterium]
MNKNFLAIGSLLGALSVALGAFAAHRLKEVFPADALGIFETGVRYQFYHVFALFIVGILSGHFSGRWINWAGYCFIAGILLFSGSLYALAALKAKDAGELGIVGVITPIGGVFFIVGWLLLFFGISKQK